MLLLAQIHLTFSDFVGLSLSIAIAGGVGAALLSPVLQNLPDERCTNFAVTLDRISACDAPLVSSAFFPAVLILQKSTCLFVPLPPSLSTDYRY